MTSNQIDFLRTLEEVIEQRKKAPVSESYTAQLVAEGTPRIAQKVGEEAVELAIASVLNDRSRTLSEAADLIYHLLVLLNQQGLRLSDVVTELESRHG
jgi:phosphoribosyl-ATP pyrophosphohydrolase/phosphoribosyl-AMP cyclohydrolase